MKSLSADYPVWLCDIWGVVHNGLKGYEAAADALSQHRKQGGIVILVTNAPRTSQDVVRHLNHLKIPVLGQCVGRGIVTLETIVNHAPNIAEPDRIVSRQAFHQAYAATLRSLAAFMPALILTRRGGAK